MLNTITIHGRLTKAPELRQTQTGKTVCSFTVAVDRASRDETDFFTCVAWERRAEFVSRYFGRGQEILVSGAMQSRNWEDKDGNKRTVWEILVDRTDFCGPRAAHTSDGVERRPIMVDEEDDGSLPF